MMSFNMTGALSFYATVLGLSLVVYWIFCRLFRVKRPGVPVLGAALTTFLFSPWAPVVDVIALVPFLVGFRVGRSTRVAVVPDDTFSPRIRISDEEYAGRVRNIQEVMMSLRGQMFLQDVTVPVPDKLAFMSEVNVMYPNSRGIVMIGSFFYFLLLDYVAIRGGLVSLGVLCMVSIPYGYCIGMLWKFMKGNLVRPLFSS